MINKLGKVLLSLAVFICIATIAIGISIGIGTLFRLGLNNVDYLETNIVNATENSNLTIIEDAPYTDICDFKDPKTGIHYIIVTKNSSVAITPRLDENENVMKD